MFQERTSEPINRIYEPVWRACAVLRYMTLLCGHREEAQSLRNFASRPMPPVTVLLVGIGWSCVRLTVSGRSAERKGSTGVPRKRLPAADDRSNPSFNRGLERLLL